LKTIFDASALLNLSNGGILNLVSTSLALEILFGPQVFGECYTIADELEDMVRAGSAHLISDDEIPATRFLSLLRKYELGAGETECLVLAERLHSRLCCDDKRARNMMIKEVGAAQVTGSLGLLLELLSMGALTMEEAVAAHTAMILRGGFLPALPHSLTDGTSS
jgi:predicted nucleic acid-binding protein